MNCAYCNGLCDDRPVSYEAVCWECWCKHQQERRTRLSPGVPPYDQGPLDWIARLIGWFQRRKAKKASAYIGQSRERRGYDSRPGGS